MTISVFAVALGVLVGVPLAPYLATMAGGSIRLPCAS
jgi:hypothetical protein